MCILKIILIYLLGEIEILESMCNRFGFSSSLYAKCSGCGMSQVLACGQHPSDDENPQTLQGKDLNRRVVFAAFESGIGKEGVAKLCEILNMLSICHLTLGTTRKKYSVKLTLRKQGGSYKREMRKQETLRYWMKAFLMIMKIPLLMFLLALMARDQNVATLPIIALVLLYLQQQERY